jgi:Transglycosylase SLT domain/Peptidase family M23
MRGKLALLIAVVGTAVATVFGVAAPTAAADACTVTVTVLGGTTYTFNVDTTPGTPISSLNLPIQGTVVSENETCAPAASGSTSTDSTTTPTTTPPSSTSTTSTATTTPTTSTTPSSTSTSTSTSRSSTTPTHSSTSTSSSTSTTPKPSAPTRKQKSSSHQQPSPAPNGQSKPEKKSAKHTAKPKHKHKHKPTVVAKAKKSKPKAHGPTGKGVPTPSNPTFSLSMPGPAPVGVPNFFIDNFQIPPFLIPIYQAAGIEYQVPWQVLAAINEIETDYGRNLSVSSAGAVGWMQFLPSTWKEWAVDANGDGVADPYNPVDAIFTAARYLHAAGASTNLSGAIFAYNHADWYVQSVLLRAKLIGGIPSQLLGALTGLVQGHFPVAAPAKYADASVLKLAKERAQNANAAVPIGSNPSSTGTSIFAKTGSPVIAVNDGKILKVGDNAQLGHYIVLQDATGNVYTYSQLGSVSRKYPVPKAVKLNAKDIAKELSAPAAKTPTTAASAGSQVTKLSSTTATKSTGSASNTTATANTAASSTVAQTTTATPGTETRSLATPMVKERLFADPARPGSYAAGGDLQLKNSSQMISSFRNYFSDTLHLARDQYTLEPLRAGSIVIAGTILGRIGGPSQKVSPHLYFQIRPAGKNAPLIDPKPVLDGWKLLEATAVYRADGVDPFFGPGAKNASVGQVLLMSKQQLTERVLADPHVQIYNCGRRDIEAGLIDRRVLATIEFLSASGLDPYVSGLDCGHSVNASTGVDEQGATGASLDISKINGIPILGHQGSGSITDITIRRLLTLQGSMAPDQIISDVSYKGQPSTLALPDHANRIQVTFTPDFGTNKKLAAQVRTLLQPGQWVQLINHISQIPEPVVPIAPSKYAIRVANH